MVGGSPRKKGIGMWLIRGTIIWGKIFGKSLEDFISCGVYIYINRKAKHCDLVIVFSLINLTFLKNEFWVWSMSSFPNYWVIRKTLAIGKEATSFRGNRSWFSVRELELDVFKVPSNPNPWFYDKPSFAWLLMWWLGCSPHLPLPFLQVPGAGGAAGMKQSPIVSEAPHGSSEWIPGSWWWRVIPLLSLSTPCFL